MGTLIWRARISAIQVETNRMNSAISKEQQVQPLNVFLVGGELIILANVAFNLSLFTLDIQQRMHADHDRRAIAQRGARGEQVALILLGVAHGAHPGGGLDAQLSDAIFDAELGEAESSEATPGISAIQLARACARFCTSSPRATEVSIRLNLIPSAGRVNHLSTVLFNTP